jgi:hypothetical protein
MQIDAKWGAALNILALVLSAIGAGTVQFAGVSPDAVHIIQTWALNLMVLLTAANSVLHLYASSTPGPLAPPDPPAVKAATAAAAKAASLVLALGLSALALGWAQPASAQDATSAPKPVVRHHKAPPVPMPTRRPPQAALAAFAAAPRPAEAPALGPNGKPKLTPTQVQQNPLLMIQQFSVEDLQAALADAQAQNPPDTTGINCYTALIPIVQSNVANPLPAGPGMFQLAQKVRDFKALAANLQSPTGPLAGLNQACAAWVLDGVNTFLQLGAQVGLVAGTGGLGGIATGGLLPMLPFQLPFQIP